MDIIIIIMTKFTRIEELEIALTMRYRDSVPKEKRIALIKLIPTEVAGAGGDALVVEFVEQKPE